jgi:hypothetical protein
VDAPCESVVAIATQSSAEAAVLCNDQTIFETVTGGTVWSAAIFISGAVALNSRDGGYAVAVVEQGGCAGISIVTLAESSGGVPVGCTGEVPPPGQTALAVGDGDSIWLWAGSILVKSTNGGTTWQ